MKIHKLITTIIFLYVSMILFFSISAHSQEQKKSSAENEQINKSFKTIQEVWTTPFKNQGYTSTCWAFSTTSFLESEAHRLGRGDFEISQMFTIYYAYLEKAQRHILSHTENPFGPGGQSHDVIYLIGKYGAVPRINYPGNMNIDNIYDDREMFKALSGMLSGVSDAGKDIPLGGQIIDGQFSWYWLTGFNSVLDAYLGKPLDSIMHNNENMSPKKFADEVLNLPLNDYIEITSYSQFPFYSANELLLPDNWLHYNKFWVMPRTGHINVL